jgi:Ca2+-binding RTX toxin-like protein
MPTIPEIEANLLLASSTGNATLFATTLASITTAQKPLITVYPQTLSNLTFLSSPTLAESMTRNMMSTVGTYVDAFSIGSAMEQYSQGGNWGALDAVTDYLSATQKTTLGTTASPGNTLLNITFNDDPFTSADDAVIASAVRDLMTKLGAQTNAFDIGVAMEQFSQSKNWGALDAVTDFLTAGQKTTLGTTASPGTTLLNITFNDDPFTTTDDAAIAAVVRDLMIKLGAQTNAFDIGMAMEQFSQSKNWGALDAVTDYLTPAQKTTLGTTASPGTTLLNITFNDDPFTTADDTAIANVVRDLMFKLGIYTNAFDIGMAMEQFSQSRNFGALDAVTDYLTAAQKTTLGTTPAPGTTLLNITFNDDPFTTADDALIASTVRDLMIKLGAQTNAFDIGTAMEQFSQNRNFGALDAVTDYLTTAQKTTLGTTPAPGNTLLNITFNDDPFTTTDDVLIKDTVRDMMFKLGVQTNAFDIGVAMEQFSQNRNFGALDAVTDYLTTTQKTTLGTSPAVGNALLNVAFNDDPFTTADDILISNVARDLMVKLNGQVNEFDLATATQVFAGNGNVNGVDAVIGELTSTQFTSNLQSLIAPALSAAGITLGTQSANTYTGTSAANKYLGLGGNDTLSGLDGNDQLYGDAGTDILYGGNHNDTLNGGTGNDTLYGDAGNDILFGGRGSDTLYGGANADTFVFDANDRGSGSDTIKDFSTAQGDKIDISDVLEQHDGSEILSQFVRLTTSGANTLLQVDMDGTGGSFGFTTVATIENVIGLDLNTLVNNGTIIV